MDAKILVLDIETRPALVYSFQMFKTNIGHEQVVEPGRPICFAAKWVGEKEMHFYSEWQHGRQAMIEAAHRLISEADAVVWYNGDRFDLPKLMGEFLLAGLAPPPPVTSIDPVKTVKKLGFDFARLAFIGPLLHAGTKVKNEGFPLWIKVMEGDEFAQRRMERYCRGDVRLLERVYKHIRPYIRNHPHMGLVAATACGACGSVHVQKRGVRRTKSFLIQRIQCQSCGSWSDGPRKKVQNNAG